MARTSRPARWPLIVLALALVGLGTYTLLGGGEDDDDAAPSDDGRDVSTATTEVPSRAVDGAPDPIEVDLTTYAVTYRVEGFTNDGGGAVVDIERRAVRAPFASRLTTVRAEDEAAGPTFVQVTDLGLLATGRIEDEPATLANEPGVGAGSATVDLDLEAAVDAGLVEWRHEERTVLDRRCQVFRTGGPIDVGSLTAPDGETWADLCVGDDGLLLQEDWYIDGDLFRRRTVIELDTSPSFRATEFEPSEPLADEPTVGRFVELTPDSRPPEVTHYELPRAPDGFHFVGRFGYSPPRAEIDFSQGEPTKVAIVLDLYEDGDGGMLVVANGGTSDGSATVTPAGGRPTADLGPIGIAEVVLGVHQNELRIGFEHGRFLRVYGTLPVAELSEVARALVPNDDPGGTVTAK